MELGGLAEGVELVPSTFYYFPLVTFYFNHIKIHKGCSIESKTSELRGFGTYIDRLGAVRGQTETSRISHSSETEARHFPDSHLETEVAVRDSAVNRYLWDSTAPF